MRVILVCLSQKHTDLNAIDIGGENVYKFSLSYNLKH